MKATARISRPSEGTSCRLDYSGAIAYNSAMERISVNQVRAGAMPESATGVCWTDTDNTECSAHLTDPSWGALATPSDAAVGIILGCPVACDAGQERDES